MAATACLNKPRSTQISTNLAQTSWIAAPLFLRKSVIVLNRVRGDPSAVLELPESVAKLLKQLVDAMAKGHAVTLVPSETEITTQQAADLLNVSRPYAVGLIDNGVLPARMVGNQRRLPLGDVLAYKARAMDAMRETTTTDQELGFGDARRVCRRQRPLFGDDTQRVDLPGAR